MTMLIEYIAALQKLADEHGPTLDVEKWMPSKGRHEAPMPTLQHARRYERAGVPQFYNPAHDNPAQKGDPVIRV